MERNKNVERKSTSIMPLSNICDDPNVNLDAAFLDNLQMLLETQETSKLFTPYISQFKVINQKARSSLKKRIQKSDPFREKTCRDADVCMACGDGDGGRCDI